MYIQNETINGIVKQEDPIDIIPKFNIFDADQPDILKKYHSRNQRITFKSYRMDQWNT